MKKFFTATLMRKMLSAFLAVSFISISVVGIISYMSAKKALTSKIEDALAGVAQGKELALVQYLRGKVMRTEAMAEDKYLRDSLENLYQKPSEEGGKSLSKYLVEEKLPSIQEGGELFVVNLQGKVVAATVKNEIGADRSTFSYFTDGKDALHVMDIHNSPVTGKPSIIFSAPIKSTNHSETIGILVNRVGTNRIEDIITERTGLADTGETYIVNKDGLMITSSRFVKDAFLKQKVDTEPVKLFHDKKQTMIGLYYDYRGQHVLGASNGDMVDKEFDLGWTILTEIDEAEAFADVRNLLIKIVLAGVVIAGLVGLLGFFISKAISEPIKKISGVAVKVAEGDLTATIDVNDSADEVGILTRVIGNMVMTLRNVVSQVLSVAERVSASSQELSSSAQEMNATTEEVSSTVQQISKGTETQAQRVDETQKVMEQMAASVEQVSKSAQSAASQAGRSSEMAQKGGELTKDARNKIVHIANEVVASASTVKKLGERSDQIGEIVGVITNIADQTNLLALNAAIEAARAGEYGRGFAVVAEEVRKLAESSAKAAEEIGKLIKDVQKETTQAVSVIEGVAKEASSVNDITQQVVQSLSEIIKNTEGVASVVEQVSAASQQQAAGAKQVSKSVADIASVAEETASSTEEASASTEEMTASMEEMAASSQELADMGMQLRDLVAKFKVDGSGNTREEKPSLPRVSDSSKFAKLREHAVTMKKKMESFRKVIKDTEKREI